jgi:mRNA interferase HigB
MPLQGHFLFYFINFFIFLPSRTTNMKKIIAKSTLKGFWEKYPDSEQYLKIWYELVKKSNWENPNHLKQTFANASIIKGGRVVFNIKGNAFRIVVKINFEKQWVFIRFVGTHEQYNKIDSENI